MPFDYINYSDNALEAHTSRQAPQSAQLLSSTMQSESTIERASTGQTSTHSPQPVHLLRSTTTAMSYTPWNYCLKLSHQQIHDGNVYMKYQYTKISPCVNKSKKTNDTTHLESLLESYAATIDVGPKPRSINSSLKTVAMVIPSRNVAIINTNCWAVNPEQTKSDCSFFSCMSCSRDKCGIYCWNYQ